jgi:DNA-binding beta-propeller fold protein YncE
VGSPFSAGTSPISITVDPFGKFAYVANILSNNVSAFTIDATGALAPVAGSPFAGFVSPASVAVYPSGKFAYVSNRDAANVCLCDRSERRAHRRPGLAVPHGPRSFLCHSGLLRVRLHGNQRSNTVSAFTIDAITGALTPSGRPVPTGRGPVSLAMTKGLL